MEVSLRIVSSFRESPRPQAHCSRELSLWVLLEGGPFYSLVGSDLSSLMVRGLEFPLSQGRLLAGALPADQGVPPFCFHHQGKSMTGVMVSQWGGVVIGARPGMRSPDHCWGGCSCHTCVSGRCIGGLEDCEIGLRPLAAVITCQNAD